MKIFKNALSSLRELRPLKAAKASRVKTVLSDSATTPRELGTHATPTFLERSVIPEYKVDARNNGWQDDFWRYLDTNAGNKSQILKEFHNYRPAVFAHKEVQEAIHKLSEKELKVTLKEIEEFNEKLPKRMLYNEKTKEVSYTAHILSNQDISNLLILKANKPETYEYILKQDGRTAATMLNNLLNINGSGIKTLTPQQCKIIFNGNKGDFTILSQYVENSDEFLKDKSNIQRLSQELSSHKVPEAFTAFRAEKDTGMFHSIPLDKETARKTKMAILTHFNKARKVKVHTSIGQYDTHSDQKISLLKYILTKKDLTLADAMQVAKYGDEKYVNHLIELIKKSKIEDNRFKSVTFDSDFAKGWLSTQDGNTGILQNMTIKGGNQGVYASANVRNRQAEFIVNNNPKEISFSDVKYDKNRDLFSLESILTATD